MIKAGIWERMRFMQPLSEITEGGKLFYFRAFRFSCFRDSYLLFTQWRLSISAGLSDEFLDDTPPQNRNAEQKADHKYPYKDVENFKCLYFVKFCAG